MIQEFFHQSTEYISMVITADVAFTASLVRVALLDDSVLSPPSTVEWITPTSATQDTTMRVTVKLLRGPTGTASVVPGQYRLWAKVTDGAEIVLVKSPFTVRIL